MYQSRTLASGLVRKYPCMTMSEIEENAALAGAVSIWIVMGFFSRLSVLVQHKKIQQEMLIDLFGKIFVWWWVVSFEKQLSKEDWDTRDRIYFLKDWLYKNTTAERRAPWITRAENDLALAIAQANQPIMITL